MNGQHISLVGVVDGLPELRPLLDSIVPPALLPLYIEGCTLSQNEKHRVVLFRSFVRKHG